jgi:hypothetical protein
MSEALGRDLRASRERERHRNDERHIATRRLA